MAATTRAYTSAWRIDAERWKGMRDAVREAERDTTASVALRWEKREGCDGTMEPSEAKICGEGIEACGRTDEVGKKSARM